MKVYMLMICDADEDAAEQLQGVYSDVDKLEAARDALERTWEARGRWVELQGEGAQRRNEHTDATSWVEIHEVDPAPPDLKRIEDGAHLRHVVWAALLRLMGGTPAGKVNDAMIRHAVHEVLHRVGWTADEMQPYQAAAATLATWYRVSPSSRNPLDDMDYLVAARALGWVVIRGFDDLMSTWPGARLVHPPVIVDMPKVRG